MADTDEKLEGTGDLSQMSLADQEAAMQKGKGKTLLFFGVVILAVILGSFFLLSEGDEQRLYGDMGKKLNGWTTEHFDQFWGCALPGTNLKDIKTNEQLISQIMERAARTGSTYAIHVREKCLDKLGGIEDKIEALLLPEDIKSDAMGMKEASASLRSSWRELIIYLDNPQLEFDEEEARAKVIKIARGWYEFKKAHASLNKTLRTKLNKE